MRIYIMTDLEGVCGVMNFEDWCMPESRYYERGKELLTREVNAAAEGFLEGGATQVSVADGHGHGAIDGTMLHGRVSLSRGWRPNRLFGLDEKPYDAIAWVGQHAMSGTTFGHLCHTGSFSVRQRAINGVAVGEFGELALCASEVGVRAIFGCGDEAFTKEAQALVPGIETVGVKRGAQAEAGNHLPREGYAKHNLGATHLPIEEARQRIREGAKRAVERAKQEDFGIVKLDPPYERVYVYRGDAVHPPRVSRAQHPSSIVELVSAPWDVNMEPVVGADPLKCL